VETAIRSYLDARARFKEAAVPVPPGPVGAVPSGADVSDTVKNAQRLLATGNLADAVHETIAGLHRAPDNDPLKQMLQNILGAAEERANAAKRGADASGLSGVGEYGRANAELGAAGTSKRSGRVDDAEPAVRGYVAAADAFMSVVDQQAQALLKQGNLTEAARVAAAGLKAIPGQPSLQKTLQLTVDAAARHANDARKKADDARADGRPEYKDAAAKLSSASDSIRANHPEQAVQEYADADRRFGDAARLGPPVSPTTPPTGNRGAVTPPAFDIAPVMARVDRDVRQDDLGQAAHELVDAAGHAPNNEQLANKLREIVGNAQKAANTAKGVADTAGASGRSEYRQAASRLEAADNSSRGGRPEDSESAVRAYVEATDFFKRASSGLAADKDAINGVLNDYQDAYNTLNADRVKQVDPSASVKQLQDQFKLIGSVRLNLADRKISVSGNSATVQCTRQIDVVEKRARETNHNAMAATVTLQKSPNGWTIVNIKQ
jgi:hypothetical protein